MKKCPITGFEQPGGGISVERLLDKQTLIQHLVERLHRDLPDRETFRYL
jgi:hypothetical protein